MIKEAQIKALIERLRREVEQRRRWAREDYEIDQGRSQFHNGAAHGISDAAEKLEMLLETSSQ